MITTTIFPGRYVQGYDALQSLGDEVLRLGQRTMILVDPFVKENLLDSFLPAVEEKVALKVELWWRMFR